MIKRYKAKKQLRKIGKAIIESRNNDDMMNVLRLAGVPEDTLLDEAMEVFAVRMHDLIRLSKKKSLHN